jgi:putative cell wall-binding protein
MALHGIMSIGIVINNTNNVEQNSINESSYVTSPTANIHENMIITNTDNISGGEASQTDRVKRRLPASILGGLGDDKQQERENMTNSKLNKVRWIIKSNKITDGRVPDLHLPWRWSFQCQPVTDQESCGHHRTQFHAADPRPE